MIRGYLLFLIFIFVTIQPNTLFASDLKDPFMTPPLISCEELEAILRTQLDVWQYSGHINSQAIDNQVIAIIRSTNSKMWFQISDRLTSVSFLPWKITAVSALSIEWQSDLPRYCERNLTVTMNFQGK